MEALRSCRLTYVFFKATRPDLLYYLDSILGGNVTAFIDKPLNELHQFIKSTKNHFRNSCFNYLHYEQSIYVSKEQWQYYLLQMIKLQHQLDRLEAKIQCLGSN